jgi:hypothetical protein
MVVVPKHKPYRLEEVEDLVCMVQTDGDFINPTKATFALGKMEFVRLIETIIHLYTENQRLRFKIK